MKFPFLKLLLCFSVLPLWPGVSVDFPDAGRMEAANMIDESIQTSGPLAKGTWGGMGINFEVADEGADIQFDCAHGSINQKMTPDREGKFEAKGIYVREGPGPIRQGRIPAEQPVTYTGVTDGKTMTITIRVEGSDEVIATYELTHGRSGRVRKCK